MTNPHITSLVLITSIDTMTVHHSEVLQFFSHLQLHEKNLIIYSPKPILDYSHIKKIPADEMIIIHQKDFFPLNAFLKPTVTKLLSQKSYSALIHFHTGNHIRNTYLISKNIKAMVKITNTKEYAQSFSIIISSSTYLNNVLDCLEKLVL